MQTICEWAPFFSFGILEAFFLFLTSNCILGMGPRSCSLDPYDYKLLYSLLSKKRNRDEKNDKVLKTAIKPFITNTSDSYP